MANYNIFVLWSDGTWKVFTTKTDDINNYIVNYRLANIGKIVEIFFEVYNKNIK